MLTLYTVPDVPSVQAIPLAQSSVAAGFPSPAEGRMEGTLDLNQLVIRRPHATFFVRVEGGSMRGAGILAGDLLVVDRGEPVRDGSVVLAVLNGEFTVKRWRCVSGRWVLQPAHPDYPSIEVGECDFEIWGVVTHSVRNHLMRTCSP